MNRMSDTELYDVNVSMHSLIQAVVKECVPVILTWDKDKQTVRYDLNTGMKSHLHLYEINNEIVYDTRYGNAGIIDNFNQLLNVAKSCLTGRDYASAAWWVVFKKYSV